MRKTDKVSAEKRAGGVGSVLKFLSKHKKKALTGLAGAGTGYGGYKLLSGFDPLPNFRRGWEGAPPGSAEANAISSHNADVRNKAVMSALRLAGIGLLAGGGTRMLQEASRRYLEPDEKGLGGPDEVSIDIHRPSRKKKRRRKKRTKRADAQPESPMRGTEDWIWSNPLMLGGAGAGMYGGYKGMQAISDWLKRREAESELEAAKQEFEEALDEQYAASKEKFSSLNKSIDSAYDTWLNSSLDKEASFTATAGGLGIGAAALLWLLSHQAAYGRLKKSDPEKFQKKLLEHRRRVRQSISPPPVIFDVQENEDEEKEANWLGDLADKGMDLAGDISDSASNLVDRAGKAVSGVGDSISDFVSGMSNAGPKLDQASKQMATDGNSLKPAMSKVNDPQIMQGMKNKALQKAQAIPGVGNLLFMG